MIIRNPKKKCIAKKCEDCHFFQHWNMEDDKGQKAVKEVCSIQVLCDEVPRLKGAIDGCQRASNETRNYVIDFGDKAVKTIKGAFEQTLVIDHKVKKIEG